jgi:hypothetical protein
LLLLLLLLLLIRCRNSSLVFANDRCVLLHANLWNTKISNALFKNHYSFFSEMKF